MYIFGGALYYRLDKPLEHIVVEEIFIFKQFLIPSPADHSALVRINAILYGYGTTNHGA